MERNAEARAGAMGGLEDYKIVRCVGKGSFGKVYLCRHIRENRHYCMKCIKLTNIPAAERAACRHEVKLMQRLSHPNIVGYKDSFFAKRGTQLCIVMTYCDGGDLSERVKRQTRTGRRFKEDQILHWFVQIALGLHFMHENRVLHRDLKTQNIFLLGNGRLVLGDLGISKVLEGTQNFAQTCIGTPYYMSPELFKNKPYNHKSDVWALGCILYELCTLKHAFDAKSLNGLASKILKGTYPAISRSYSTHTRKLVKDMLAKSPHQRPDLPTILSMPFIRKRVQNFMCDVIMASHQPGRKTSLDSGTMVMRGAFLQAGGQMSGAAAGGAVKGGLQAAKDMMALQSQLEGLGMKQMIAAALRDSGSLSPSENEHDKGNKSANDHRSNSRNQKSTNNIRKAGGGADFSRLKGMPPRHSKPVSVRDERSALAQAKKVSEAQKLARMRERDARDALRREKERKLAVENALEKLRKEREMRMKQRQVGVAESRNARRRYGRVGQRQRIRSKADHMKARNARVAADMKKRSGDSSDAESRNGSNQGVQQNNPIKKSMRVKSRDELLREKKAKREAEFRREQRRIDERSKKRQEAAARNRARQQKQRGRRLRSNKQKAPEEDIAAVERVPSADVISGGGVGGSVNERKPRPPRSHSSAANYKDPAVDATDVDENFADAPRRVRDLDLWDRKQKARAAALKEKKEAASIASAAPKASDRSSTPQERVPSTPDRAGKPNKKSRAWAKAKWKAENDKMGDILEQHRRKREQEARRRKEVAKAAEVARGSASSMAGPERSDARKAAQESSSRPEGERGSSSRGNGAPVAPLAKADGINNKRGIRGRGANGDVSRAPKVVNPFPRESDKVRPDSSKNPKPSDHFSPAGNEKRRVASAGTPSRNPERSRRQQTRTPSPPRSPKMSQASSREAWAQEDVAQMPKPQKVEGGLSAREQMLRRKAERQRLKDEETKRRHLEAAEQQRQERVRAKQKNREQYISNIPSAAMGFGQPAESLSSPPAPSLSGKEKKQPITPLPPITGDEAVPNRSLERHADNAVDNWLPDSRYGSTESIEYSQDHFASKYDEGKMPEKMDDGDQKGSSGISQPDFDSVADEAIDQESPAYLSGDHDSYVVSEDGGLSSSDDDNDFEPSSFTDPADEEDDAAEEELLAAKEAELKLELTQAENRIGTLRASMALARKEAGGKGRVRNGRLNPEDDMEEHGESEDSSGSGEGSRIEEEDEEEYEFDFDPEYDHIPSGHTFRVSRSCVCSLSLIAMRFLDPSHFSYIQTHMHNFLPPHCTL